MLRSGPDAQPILQREDDDRNDLDAREDALIGGLVARDGIEHHRGHIDEDQQDQQPLVIRMERSPTGPCSRIS